MEPIFRFVLIVVIFAHCYIAQDQSHQFIPQQNTITKNVDKPRTLYDLQTRTFAYKDLKEPKCLLEIRNNNESIISQILATDRTALLKVSLSNLLTKREVWRLGGTRISDFCRGFPSYLIQNTLPIIDPENELPIVEKVSGRRTKRYIIPHYLRRNPFEKHLKSLSIRNQQIDCSLCFAQSKQHRTSEPQRIELAEPHGKQTNQNDTRRYYIQPGRGGFSGQLNGQYESETKVRGKFSGTFQGSYEADGESHKPYEQPYRLTQPGEPDNSPGSDSNQYYAPSGSQQGQWNPQGGWSPSGSPTGPGSQHVDGGFPGESSSTGPGRIVDGRYIAQGTEAGVTGQWVNGNWVPANGQPGTVPGGLRGPSDGSPSGAPTGQWIDGKWVPAGGTVQGTGGTSPYSPGQGLSDNGQWIDGKWVPSRGSPGPSHETGPGQWIDGKWVPTGGSTGTGQGSPGSVSGQWIDGKWIPAGSPGTGPGSPGSVAGQWIDGKWVPAGSPGTGPGSPGSVSGQWIDGKWVPAGSPGTGPGAPGSTPGQWINGKWVPDGGSTGTNQGSGTGTWSPGRNTDGSGSSAPGQWVDGKWVPGAGSSQGAGQFINGKWVPAGGSTGTNQGSGPGSWTPGGGTDSSAGAGQWVPGGGRVGSGQTGSSGSGTGQWIDGKWVPTGGPGSSSQWGQSPTGPGSGQWAPEGNSRGNSQGGPGATGQWPPGTTGPSGSTSGGSTGGTWQPAGSGGPGQWGSGGTPGSYTPGGQWPSGSQTTPGTPGGGVWTPGGGQNVPGGSSGGAPGTQGGAQWQGPGGQGQWSPSGSSQYGPGPGQWNQGGYPGYGGSQPYPYGGYPGNAYYGPSGQIAPGQYTQAPSGPGQWVDGKWVPSTKNETTETVDDADSSVLTSVTQTNNETVASAEAHGKYQGGTAQSQVSGTYTGSGSFSASAGSDDGKRGALTKVSGGKDGAQSTAHGRGGLGQSKAEVTLDSQSGDTLSTAETSGREHGTQTQVQASQKGGLSDAQANGLGPTSSQARIGFTPHEGNDTTDDDQTGPFRGGGVASAKSGTNSGMTQTEIDGKFLYGLRYHGAAQAGSGSLNIRNITEPTNGFRPINFTVPKINYVKPTESPGSKQTVTATPPQKRSEPTITQSIENSTVQDEATPLDVQVQTIVPKTNGETEQEVVVSPSQSQEYEEGYDPDEEYLDEDDESTVKPTQKMLLPYQQPINVEKHFARQESKQVEDFGDHWIRAVQQPQVPADHWNQPIQEKKPKQHAVQDPEPYWHRQVQESKQEVGQDSVEYLNPSGQEPIETPQKRRSHPGKEPKQHIVQEPYWNRQKQEPVEIWNAPTPEKKPKQQDSSEYLHHPVQEHMVLDPVEDLTSPETQTEHHVSHGMILQPGQLIPGSPGFQIPAGFRGRVHSLSSSQLPPNSGKIFYQKSSSSNPILGVITKTAYQNGFSYQPVRYRNLPSFVTMTKSVSGYKSLDPGVYYTKSRSCSGEFTDAC